MNSSVGSVLIGVSIFTSVILGFILHSRYCKKRCPDCSSDVETAVKDAEKAVPKAVWASLGKDIIKCLTPRKQKIAETVLEAVEEVMHNEASTSHS